MMRKKMRGIGITIGVILTVCLLMVGFINLTGLTVKGSMDAVSTETEIAHAGEEIDDYDLIVMEDEELPAAAVAPVENKASKALWVMTAVFVLVLLIGYELWYEGMLGRIKTLSVGDSEEDGILKDVSRLHPFKTVNARKEMESKAAEEYFKK